MQAPAAFTQGEGGGAPEGEQPEHARDAAGVYVRAIGLEEYDKEVEEREKLGIEPDEPLPDEADALSWLLKPEAERSVSDATPELGVGRNLFVVEKNPDLPGSFFFREVKDDGTLSLEKHESDEEGKVEIDI